MDYSVNLQVANTKMSPSSSGPRRRTHSSSLFHLVLAILITQELFVSIICNPFINSDVLRVRARRQAREPESLLTVEWEGIQSGDHPDSSIRGFIVEYRAEKEAQWNVHSGVIPYKGPNHQYRVQIPKLPTGISYFVRIKVLGEKNEVLVETPEIRARNEIVSIKCEADEITAPRDVDVKETGQFSVALAWQPPECGSVGEYHVELRGKGSQLFDVHRQTVAQPSASITGLLSGTEYGVRIRAVDRSRTLGPWNEELTTVSTKGDVPESSADVTIEYKSNTEVRIRWKHFDDERLQHYEVILVELDKNEIAQRSERSRVGPTENSMLFTDLAPQTEYKVGVVAYVDHEPKHVFRLTFSTADQSTLSLEMAPVVVKEGNQHYQVHWKKPERLDIQKFLVEYRPNNDSKWQKVSEERMATDGQESYSVAASELVDAFSVRVVLVDSKQTAVARSKEVLVSSGDQETACDADAGVVRSVSVKSTANSLTFSWKKPVCDEKTSTIVGYEYSIWKPEDDHTPPETTSFSEKPSVFIEGLDTNNVYLFRCLSANIFLT